MRNTNKEGHVGPPNYISLQDKISNQTRTLNLMFETGILGFDLTRHLVTFIKILHASRLTCNPGAPNFSGAFRVT